MQDALLNNCGVYSFLRDERWCVRVADRSLTVNYDTSYAGVVVLTQCRIAGHDKSDQGTHIPRTQHLWVHKRTNMSTLLRAPYDLDAVIKQSPGGQIVRNASAKDIAIWRNYTTGTSPYFCKVMCCWRWIPAGFPYKGGRPKNVTARDILSPAQNKLLGDALLSLKLPHPPRWPASNLFHIKMTECLQPGTVLFVETPDLPYFFETVFPSIRHPFVLVSGDSDLPAPGSYSVFLSDPKLMHWVAMNCDTDATFVPKLSCLPLGISQWIPVEPILQQLRAKQGLVEGILPNNHHPKDKPGRNLLFAAFTVRPGVRQELWELACSPNGRLRNITTCSTDISERVPLPVNETLKAAAEHAFVLAPTGVGLDTHR